MADNISTLPEAGIPTALHPYYPLGVKIQGYVANIMTRPGILGYFTLACIVVLGPALIHIKHNKPHLPTSEVATALWFILCSCIHTILEGYFAINHLTMGSDSSLLGEMWKEYSLSDSRYLTSDSFVVCMESITALFWGPLSLLCAHLIVTNHPARHQLQTIVSLGQLYGVVLYYATCSFDEAFRHTTYSVPDPVYFWGYYVLLNSFWAVVPAVLIYQSTRASIRAFSLSSPGKTKRN